MIVSKAIPAHVRVSGGRSGGTTVELAWDTADPLAVALVTPGNKGKRWEFARELLARGMFGKAGHGDVVIWPEIADDLLVISLRPPHGRADLVMSRTNVREFIAATQSVQTVGQEDLGDELDRWLTDLPENNA